MLRGGLLTDDMGLGKTLTALLLVELSPLLNNPQSPPAASPIFKPTLIACPSSAFGAWKAKITKFFPHLTQKYFMGSRSKGSVIERSRVLGTRCADLRSFVEGLDPHNPETARVIVLHDLSRALTIRLTTPSFASIRIRSKHCFRGGYSLLWP